MVNIKALCPWTLIEFKKKERARRETIVLSREKVKTAKAKERWEKEKGKEDHQKGKGKGKEQKGKGVGPCFTCGKPGHLAKECWRNHTVRQVANDPGQSVAMYIKWRISASPSGSSTAGHNPSTVSRK